MRLERTHGGAESPMPYGSLAAIQYRINALGVNAAELIASFGSG